MIDFLFDFMSYLVLQGVTNWPIFVNVSLPILMVLLALQQNGPSTHSFMISSSISYVRLIVGLAQP